jgi:hypothetical protein
VAGGYCGEETPYGTPVGPGDGAGIRTGAPAAVSVAP